MRIKEKKERYLGTKLFLKGERCNSPKCALVRRPYRPGVHGKRFKNISEFGQQLMEKQKIRFTYGLREAQMRKIFKEASSKKASLSQSVVSSLERRLDNVFFRMGFLPSRTMSRQAVSHGHILVNGKKVTVPSYQVRVGDEISIKPSSANILIFKDLPVNIKKYEAPDWLEMDKEKLKGKVKALPLEVDIPFDINLVVDFYSK